MTPLAGPHLASVAARRDRAARYLLATAPAIACSHLGATMATGGGGIICAEHPAAGIMCPRCAQHHAERHTWAVEHTCDACGAEADTLCSIVGTTPVALTTITTTGRLALYAGPLTIVTLGICPPCGGDQ